MNKSTINKDVLFQGSNAVLYLFVPRKKGFSTAQYKGASLKIDKAVKMIESNEFELLYTADEKERIVYGYMEKIKK